MFKNYVDNYKLDTNINLILHNSRNTIKKVQNYLDDDELNFAVPPTPSVIDLIPKEHIKEVPPVWDEDLHKMYVKSLVENYLSPRLSIEGSKINLANIRSIAGKSSSQSVLKSKSTINNNTPQLDTRFSNNSYDIEEKDIPLNQADNLQWKPVKTIDEKQKNRKNLPFPNDKKNFENQTFDLPNSPRTNKTLVENKKPVKKSVNKNPLHNKKLADISDNQKIATNSARSSKKSDGKNSKSSKVEATFIRFIGKQNKHPIDFDKEHPGIVVETSENCNTLFPKRFLRSESVCDNEQIENKIDSSIPKTLKKSKIKLNQPKESSTLKNSQKENSNFDRSKMKSKKIKPENVPLIIEEEGSNPRRNEKKKKKVEPEKPLLTLENYQKEITNVGENKIKNKKNIPENDQMNEDIKSTFKKTKIFNIIKNQCSEEVTNKILNGLDAKKSELSQNLVPNNKSNNLQQSFSRNQFTQRIIKEFIEYQNIKKKSAISSKSESSTEILYTHLPKNQFEDKIISSDQPKNESEHISLCPNIKDNSRTLIQNEELTWHDVLVAKNIEVPYPEKLKDNEIQNISETKKNDKNIEVIYDKSKGFEVKQICVNNNNKFKKLKIKTLPVFCIRGECKVQKATSIEIKPIENNLKPLQNNNIQYFQFVYDANNEEITESTKISSTENKINQINGFRTKKDLSPGFKVIEDTTVTRNFNCLHDKNNLSTIVENDDDNQFTENKLNVNAVSQAEKFSIVPRTKFTSVLTANKQAQNLLAIDLNIQPSHSSQSDISSRSNPLLSFISPVPTALNTHNFEETLSTQTDEEKLCLKHKSILSDTNQSEDESEIGHSSKISDRIQNKSISSSSINSNSKMMKNNEIQESKDILSILENVFLKALRSNKSSPKESSSSSSRSALESTHYKRKESIKKKYINLAKQNNFKHMSKEASVQTEDLKPEHRMVNQKVEQDIDENLVENIFEKIRNDVPVGLKEFKSYNQLKNNILTSSNLVKEDKADKYAKIKNLKRSNKVIKFSIIDKEKNTENKSVISRHSARNHNDLHTVSNLSILSKTNDENIGTYTFRLNSSLDLDGENSGLDMEGNCSKPIHNELILDNENLTSSINRNLDKLKANKGENKFVPSTFRRPEIFDSRKSKNLNTSESNLEATIHSENSIISKTDEKGEPILPLNYNLELDDGTSSMFSLASDGIVFDKINYECRSLNVSNSSSQRTDQNDKFKSITRTVEKVLKDGESFRSNSHQKSKKTKNNFSPEVQNAVKYFLDNLNNSKDSVKANGNSNTDNNDNNIKINKILQLTSSYETGASFHITTNNKPKINNTNYNRTTNLNNIIGCNGTDKSFNASSASFETSLIDKLNSDNFKTKKYHVTRKDLHSYGSSISSHILKNDCDQNNINFESLFKKYPSNSSSNIDLHELYYSSTDDFLLSEQGDDKNLRIEEEEEIRNDNVRVSDGEILSIGEIKNDDT